MKLLLSELFVGRDFKRPIFGPGNGTLNSPRVSHLFATLTGLHVPRAPSARTRK